MVNGLNNFSIDFKIKKQTENPLGIKTRSVNYRFILRTLLYSYVYINLLWKMWLEKAQRFQPVNQINQKEYRYCLYLEGRKFYTISMKNSYVLFL